MFAGAMRLSLCGVALSLSAAIAAADALPLLHPLFDDHAVLQRGQPIRVWGWAAPGETISVSLAHATATAQADATGHWSVTLPAMDASGPHELTARSTGGANRTVRDVLIGDVWLCSGQSNMVLQVHRALDSRSEIANSANDSLRMLTLALADNVVPLETFKDPVRWLAAAPATVPDFSATCYYFARELQKTVRVPMGLVNSSWGGASIQTWMSERALRSLGSYDDLLAVLHQYATDPAAANARWGELWEAWWRQQVPTRPGFEPWSAEHFRQQDWREAPKVLDVWEKWGVPKLANFNGMVWYRTTVKLDAARAAQAATLSLGPIDEADETWVNGRPLGYTSGAGVDRVYAIPAGWLRRGENVIVVNALDTYASGGMYGAAEKRSLLLADGTAIALDAGWRYQIAPADLVPAPRAPWEPVRGLTMIHNAMLAPLVPFTLRGVIWYQGESNTEDAGRYQALLTAFMADWRASFGAQLPFLIVQLANYGPAATVPSDSGWANLREAQRLATASDAHAGLAVTIDIGDRYDLHPANKQEVGRRLARVARHVVYGESIIPSGPAPLAARTEQGRIVVTFGDVDGQLVAYGATRPIGFELCGADQSSCRYVDATIEGNRVWLEPGDLRTPTRVRFGWADSPVCTLYDKSGLPAGPFEIPIDSLSR
jgi:sialate O-acetylesterase